VSVSFFLLPAFGDLLNLPWCYKNKLEIILYGENIAKELAEERVWNYRCRAFLMPIYHPYPASSLF
jgi:hypothetical protein